MKTSSIIRILDENKIILSLICLISLICLFFIDYSAFMSSMSKSIKLLFGFFFNFVVFFMFIYFSIREPFRLIVESKKSSLIKIILILILFIMSLFPNSRIENFFKESIEVLKIETSISIFFLFSAIISAIKEKIETEQELIEKIVDDAETEALLKSLR